MLKKEKADVLYRKVLSIRLLCCIIKSSNPTTQKARLIIHNERKNQVVLPLDLGICIPEGDFVFKVAEICENLDYTELFTTYLRAWRKVNPITMFEIFVFAYMNRKFSSREIESLCETDIRFMWLLNGEPAPSASTIVRFQRGHLAEAIEGLFCQFVEKLYERGEVKFKNLFVDGTKIEAYANKYTFVWKSVVEKNLAKLEKKITDSIKFQKPSSRARHLSQASFSFCKFSFYGCKRN